jgi:hypothetical protein
VCIACLLLLPAANAQSFDANIGLGAMQAKSSSTGIDGSTLESCSFATGFNCVSTPSLNDFNMSFGGTVMLNKQLGVGGEVTLMPARQDYLVLSDPSALYYGEKIQARNTFYDFNGVFRPLQNKKALLQLEGGIGGVNIKYYETLSTSSSLFGSSSQSSNVGSANKFQVHGGVGVQIYLKGGVFIRPQFDLHYVPNLDRYGTNLIKRETIWLGYSFGR